MATCKLENEVLRIPVLHLAKPLCSMQCIKYEKYIPMKTKYLLLLLIFVIQIEVVSQTCLPEGITFTTQEQIDNFQLDYPNCTEIEGDVSILGASIQNLTGLDVLSAFNADLLIYNCVSLKDLSGLENVNYIGGNLTIKSNDSLLDLTGLNNLHVIDSGRLYISINNSLTDLTGLEGLYSIGDGIEIQSNSLLENINALENIDSTGFLIVNYNSSLKSLQGLHNIESLSHFCFIRHSSLKNFLGLEGLVSIGGDVRITNNDSLIDFTGITNLSTIKGSLEITDNVSLLSLAGLNSVDSSTFLLIHDNPSLSICEVETICSYLLNPIGSINIYNNAPGCNNPSEVANACGYTLPCLPYGNYYLLSQTDIDSFQVNYPGCHDINGSVRIEGSDINNLHGLESINSIGGNFRVYFNNALSSLSGLESLSIVHGSIQLRENNSLNSLNGINNLISCGGLFIRYNETLNSLSELSKLDSVNGELRISGNPILVNLNGLENLTNIEGALTIADNYLLERIDVFQNISSIGALWIIDNHSLNNLTGLENVVSVSSAIIIDNNEYLTSLIALQNVNSINGPLIIEENENLESLNGIANINAETISDLSINNNPLLSICAVQSVCDYLANPNGDIEIYNNAPGCDTQAEVEAACVTIGLPDFVDNSVLTIYPNPVKDDLNILLSNGLFLKEVCIYNQLGQKLLCETNTSGKLRTSVLKDGIYIIEVSTNKTRIRKLLIVKR